jgi:hypothetical protein
MTYTSTAAAFLLLAAVANANAFDIKDLTPCRAAAARLCDRSEGMTMAALWRCGATLASRPHQVSRECREVLKRYGQL